MANINFREDIGRNNMPIHKIICKLINFITFGLKNLSKITNIAGSTAKTAPNSFVAQDNDKKYEIVITNNALKLETSR